MFLIGVASVIAAGALVVIAFALLPVLSELRKTAQAVREFVTHADEELKPVLQELNGTLVDLKLLTEGITERVEEVKTLTSALGDTGRGLRTVSNAVGSVAGIFATSSAWVTGMKVAGSFLADKIAKKQRG